MTTTYTPHAVEILYKEAYVAANQEPPFEIIAGDWCECGVWAVNGVSAREERDCLGRKDYHPQCNCELGEASDALAVHPAEFCPIHHKDILGSNGIWEVRDVKIQGFDYGSGVGVGVVLHSEILNEQLHGAARTTNDSSFHFPVDTSAKYELLLNCLEGALRHIPHLSPSDQVMLTEDAMEMLWTSLYSHGKTGPMPDIFKSKSSLGRRLSALHSTFPLIRSSWKRLQATVGVTENSPPTT
jgi:hypothetical protein